MPVFASRIDTSHPVAALARDARRLLKTLGRQKAELSLSLCDDAFIQRQNLVWRNVDAATDVLSFGQNDPVLLGDVLISVDRAGEQAAEQGHDLATELRILLVHGLCHLLGHDHTEEGDTSLMRAREVALLATLGVGAASLIARVRADVDVPPAQR